MRVLVTLAATAVIGMFASVGGTSAGPAPAVSDAASNTGSGAMTAPLQRAGTNGIYVGHSLQVVQTPPLSTIPPAPPHPGDNQDHDRANASAPLPGHVDAPDPVVQTVLPGSPGFTPPQTFEGIDFSVADCGCDPPDTNGAAGKTQYVQVVNAAFQVFSKSGASLYGPAGINTLWTTAGGPCFDNNNGDPIVRYDQLADRWLISQLTVSSPYEECVAVSTSGDATGSWNVYTFNISPDSLGDYPKIAIWPDGYYMSANMFQNGSNWQGPSAFVFDRTSMLNGQPATFQTFSPGVNHGTLMPADLDGAVPGVSGTTKLPPSGAPGIFAEFGGTMNLYQFHVDWTTPANSSFTSWTALPIAAFTQLCPSAPFDCLKQPGTSQLIEGLGDRLMTRLAYRNFGTYASLVVNHSVNATPSGTDAGVRWYEIRVPTGKMPYIYQQSTYAPPNGLNRWMASIAMDKHGDMALGYSADSASTYPSILFTGRHGSDTLNRMTMGEKALWAGHGSQTSPDRWGDYSSMTVDPTDDCTFWYTNEYYSSSSGWDWQTRIGSFKASTCS